MPAKPSLRSTKPAAPRILLRYRPSDSPLGVSRDTTMRLADQLGVSETQVIHYALALLARQTLPAYEPDDGPLTARQVAAMRRLAPQGQMRGRKGLF